MRRFLKASAVIASLWVALALPALAAPLEDAMSAIDSGDFARAATLLEPLAAQGDIDAEYNLGLLYLKGEGVPRDDARAFELLSRASDQNDARAQFYLGLMYQGGQGTPVDEAKAVEQYRLAAAQGYAPAEHNLASNYLQGTGGLPRDYWEAFGWFRRAAEHGQTQSTGVLAEMYRLGVGTAQNPAEASRWYYQSLGSGADEALNGIGQLAAAGVLTTAEPQAEVAYVAFSLAVQLLGGNAKTEAMNALNDLTTRMNSDELTATKQRLKAAEGKGVERYRAANECMLVDVLMTTEASDVADDCNRFVALGVPAATYNAGWMHLTGTKLQKDEVLGVSLFLRAATADFAPAQLALAKQLAIGEANSFKIAALGWALVAQPRLTLGDLLPEYADDAGEVVASIRASLDAKEQRQAELWAKDWNAAHPIRTKPLALDAAEDGWRDTKSRNFRSALQKFTLATTIDPQYSEAWRGRAEASEYLGSFDDASTFLTTALNVDPDNDQARYDYAFVAMRLGRIDEALGTATQLVNSYPQSVEMLTLRALIYSKRRQFDEAIEDLTTALNYDLDNQRARKQRANLLYLTGRLADATADYQRLVSRSQGNDRAYAMLFAYISRRHAGEDADTMLKSYRSQLTSTDWPYAVFDFYLGAATEAQLLDAARANPLQLCEARYYVAELRLVSGDEIGGLDLLRAVADECPDTLTEQTRAAEMVRGR